MGSLMSGWSSPALSDKKVRVMRNRSLTKEEVEAFWRQHGRRPPESDGEAAVGGSPLAASPRTRQEATPLAGGRLEVTRSLPPLPSARGSTGTAAAVPWSSSSSSSYSLPSSRSEGASADSIPSWWTRSSWAFLNEPSSEREEVLLGRSRSHACDQFHAARIVTTGTVNVSNQGGISIASFSECWRSADLYVTTGFLAAGSHCMPSTRPPCVSGGRSHTQQVPARRPTKLHMGPLETHQNMNGRMGYGHMAGSAL